MSTVVGAAGYSSAQPRNYMPFGVISPAPVRSWGTNGNTDTVIDASCTANTFVDIALQTNSAGTWKVVASNGSFLVTSTDSESAGLLYAYRFRD
jgi:hypothetical protein